MTCQSSGAGDAVAGSVACPETTDLIVVLIRFLPEVLILKAINRYSIGTAFTTYRTKRLSIILHDIIRTRKKQQPPRS